MLTQCRRGLQASCVPHIWVASGVQPALTCRRHSRRPRWTHLSRSLCSGFRLDRWQPFPQASAQPTASLSSCASPVIDYQMLPHILEAIIAEAPFLSLVASRGTSRAMKSMAEARLNEYYKEDMEACKRGRTRK